MAVIFGEKQKDGWLKVTQIAYQIEKHPNGHSVKAEKIPPYPPRKPGVGYVQMFNQKTKKFRYDTVEVPLTQEESLQEVASAIRELVVEMRLMRKGKK